MHGMPANGVHKVVNRNTDSGIPRVLLSFHRIPATNRRAKPQKLGALAGIEMIFEQSYATPGISLQVVPANRGPEKRSTNNSD